MTPLRFRAWDKTMKKMVTVEALRFTHNGLNDVLFGVQLPHNSAQTVTAPECVELMQSTGLKDKNGTEIFEGDIVEWDDNSDGRWRRRCEVTWVKAHWKLVGYYYDTRKPDEHTPISFSFGAFIYEQDGELEVIGNIHENPELLK